MRTRHVIMAAIVILLVGLAIVPAALAATGPVKAQVRAEALAGTVITPTTVSVPAKATIQCTNTDGTETKFTTSFPSAFGALGSAANLQGVPMTFSANPTSTSTGIFVNSIAGFGGPPTWSSWWMYAVNGYQPDIGAGDLHLLNGDKVLFYEVSSSTPYGTPTEQLVVRAAKIGLTPGQEVTLSVFGDDLSKPNSLADATRFGLDASTVQTPAQFPAVDGATLHVGTLVYDLASSPYATGNSLTLPSLPIGTYAVWAEKASDSTTAYVRSAKLLINVDVLPVVSSVVARPNPFTPKLEQVRVTFKLSRTARVQMQVKNRSGKVLATVTRSLSAGSRSLVWSGRTSTGKYVGRGTYYLHLTATDSWGRISHAVVAKVTAR